jgi:hypothetical protein
LKGYPYLPYAKLKTRKEVKEKLLNAIKKINENNRGKYFDLESITKDNSSEFELYQNKFYDKEENFFNCGCKIFYL